MKQDQQFEHPEMSTRYRNYFKLWKVILSFAIPFALLPLALNDNVVINSPDLSKLILPEKYPYLTQFFEQLAIFLNPNFLINSHLLRGSLWFKAFRILFDQECIFQLNLFFASFYCIILNFTLLLEPFHYVPWTIAPLPLLRLLDHPDYIRNEKTKTKLFN